MTVHKRKSPTRYSRRKGQGRDAIIPFRRRSDSIDEQEVRLIVKNAEVELDDLDEEAGDLIARLSEVEERRAELVKELMLARIALQSFSEEKSRETSHDESDTRFADMTIVEAAEEILRGTKQMMTAREIADALIAGGKMPPGQKNATTIVTTTLKRYPDRLQCIKYEGINRFWIREDVESDSQ